MLTPHIEQVHTITFDNGGEFAEHKAIEEALGAETYFAHPLLFVGARSEREQQWAVEAVYPKGTDLRGSRTRMSGERSSGSTYDLGNVSDSGSELQALTQKLEKARALKQGMMQQLLTGKIRLPLAAGHRRGHKCSPTG